MSVLTIDEIRETIRSRSNGKAKLLSTKYINNTSPLAIQCECGNIFHRSYASARRSKLLCSDCASKNHGSIKYTLDYIISEIAKTGCEYVSGEYQNSLSKLLIRCRCGNLFFKTWRKFHEGQCHCPECGMAIRIEQARLKREEKQKNKPKPKPKSKIKPKPKSKLKSKSKSKIKTEQKIKNSSCSKIKSCTSTIPRKRKANRHAEIGEIVRDRLDPWKRQIRRKYNNTCPITGETGDDIVVHHLFSLNQIFMQTTQQLSLNCSMSDVINLDANPEYINVITDIINKHDLTMGIVISTEIHKQFHYEYGYGNNTPQQFDEFLQNHFQTTLEDLKGEIS